MKVCPACRIPFAAEEWRCARCAWSAPRQGTIAIVGGAEPAAGFSADFFDPLAAVEDTHFWFAARNALIAWAVARYFPGAATFLDAGCGNGQVSRALQQAFPALRLTACEAFLEGLATAGRKAPRAELVQADVRDLPWVDEFDVVGAFDVIEHVDDDRTAVRQLARATRPGGGVLITVPQHDWLWSPLDEYSGHVRRYTRARLRACLSDAGLRVERLTSFVSLLLPMLAWSRISRRDAAVDPGAEFRVPAAVNAIGAALMGVERTVIRAGLSLPAGGSLLAVARRSDA